MAYQSSLLGSTRTLSANSHFDLLRNDITTAKTFAAAGVKYIQLSHNETDSKIVSSSGVIRMNGGANGVYVEEAAGVKYLQLSHDGTKSLIASSSGAIFLKGSAGNGIAVYDTTSAKYVGVYHNSTDSVINSNDGILILNPLTPTVRIGAAGAPSSLQMYNASNALVTITVSAANALVVTP